MEIKVIEERELLGKEFKIYGDFENPLFLAKDVAEWINYGISNVSKMVKNIDENEKIITRTNGTSATFITEDGLYEVLMQSKQPIAKEFKKQVKGILKTIRKHGMYAKDEILENPDLLIEVAGRLKKEMELRKQLETKVTEDRPKVIFAESVEASKTSILIGELAKLIKQNGIDIGQKRLFSWLREKGYLIKANRTDYNMPTQKSMDMKLFEIKETAITHSDGHITINKTTKVTGKGQIYFINKFIDELVG